MREIMCRILRNAHASPVPRSTGSTQLPGWVLLVLLGSLCTDKAIAATEASQPGADLESRSGYEDIPQVGGPTGPAVSLVRDDQEKAHPLPLTGWSDRLSDHWFSAKQRLYERRGLAFGFSYNVLGQGYIDAEESSAVGGVFDAVLSWTLTGRDSENPGRLVILAENQHRLGTELSPEAAGVTAGSVLPTASFSDTGWHLNNFHWSQNLAGEAAILIVGIVDTADYVDYHALNDPLTAFSSFAFSGTPGTPIPDPGAGVIFRAASESFYVTAGIADGSTEAGKRTSSEFFSGAEHFTHLEVGATPEFQERFVENVHLTMWHQARHEEMDTPDDWGAALGLSTRFTDRTNAIVRAAFSRGRATLVARSVSVGGAYTLRSFDRVGVGLNWSRPSEGSRDQFTLESFYRFQFGPTSTVTPHLQFIVNPAVDSERSLLAVLGLRLRFAL